MGAVLSALIAAGVSILGAIEAAGAITVTVTLTASEALLGLTGPAAVSAIGAALIEGQAFTYAISFTAFGAGLLASSFAAVPVGIGIGLATSHALRKTLQERLLEPQLPIVQRDQPTLLCRIFGTTSKDGKMQCREPGIRKVRVQSRARSKQTVLHSKTNSRVLRRGHNNVRSKSQTPKGRKVSFSDERLRKRSRR